MIIVRYGEIGLKGKLRSWFDNLLVKNMLKVLREEERDVKITREWGRIYVHTQKLEDEEDVAKRLTGVFGVTSTSVALEIEPLIEKIIETARTFKPLISKDKTFAVRARRVGKHSFSSMDIQKKVGAYIQEETGAKVDLENPDTVIYIEARQKKAFIYSSVFSGYGGLPVGSQERILSIISDDKSLLSSWFALRRGCDIDLLAKTKDFQKFKKILSPWASYREIKLAPWEDVYYNGNNIGKKGANKLENMLRNAFKLHYKAAYCSATVDEIEGLIPVLCERSMPVFTPLISLSCTEISDMIKIIKNRFKNTKK